MATVSITLLSEVRKATQGINDVNNKLGSVGKVAKLAGGAIAGAFATQKIIAGFKSVVSAASDAEQSLGATETVFGKFSDSVVKDSKRAATQFGLSANEYRENANLIGSLFKNQGVSMDQLSGKTKSMIGTASDLAATFGGSTKSAVEALSSAFKGEFNPLERYGISMKQSTVNAEAMRLANAKSAKEWNALSDAQQKAYTQQATSNLIMKQSKDSAGAFAKETNTLAHQQQVLSAQFDNVKVAIGTRLLPIITKFLTFVTTNMPKVSGYVSGFTKKVKELFSGFDKGSGKASGKLATFLSTVQTVWTSIKTIFQSAISVVTSLWNAFGQTIVTFAINTFTNLMTYLRGVFSVIQGIFQVFAGILKGDWSMVWTGIKSIVTGAWSIIKAIVSQGWNIIKTLFKAAGTVIKALFKAAWNALKGIVTSAWNGVKGAVSAGVSKAIAEVKKLPSKIKGAMSGAGSWLKNAGKEIIQGLIKGITDKIGALKNKLKSVTNLIPKIKGPLSYDKVMLKPAGQAIMQGLIDGIEKKENALRQTLRGVSKTVSNTNVGTIGDGKLAVSQAKNGDTYVTIKVEATPATDKRKLGKELAEALEAYMASGGRVNFS